MNIEKTLKAVYDKLENPVIFFDCETTGLDTTQDDIIQLYACQYDENGFTENEMYFNTKRTISEGALEKHKITSEFLKDFPYLDADQAEIVWDLFKGDAIVCGYNHKNFDIPILIENLLRAGNRECVSLLKRPLVDVYKEYVKANTNELEVVFRRITGENMENAHNAVDDIYATSRILEELMKTSDIIPESSNQLDLSGFFVNEGNGLAFAKGKHKGKIIKDMNQHEATGYLDWISKNEGISKHTRLISQKLRAKLLQPS